jgi:hypothetical protein
LGALKDQRNPLLQLTGKQFMTPPDLVVKDPGGKQLVVNPQALAFSDSGSWLVVETLEGSFVRINLATLDMTAFTPAFGSQGSPGLLESQVAVSSDGRYVAISNKAAESLKVYDLDSCGGPVVGLQPQKCAAYDYWPFLKQQVSGFQSVTHLRFVNDGLLGFEPLTSDPASGGSYELAPRGSIKSLIDYLGLGDSYTSGEGAFDYRLGTDTADDMCHLSDNSYPVLLTRDLFSAAGGHSVACSGAVINDVGSTSATYRGQVRGVPDLAQLQQSQADWLDSIMAGYSPVGGDDIGFGDILRNCVAPHISLHPAANSCYNAYEDRLELTKLVDRTVPRWTALYKQLLAEAPGARVYAIGYPQIVSSTGNCALNVHLDQSEAELAEGLIDYINNDIRQAAANAGVTYVDISQALAGHRLCETASYNVAVNGLTAGTDGAVLGIRVFGKESYHPNALGQELIEQAILRQTNNLTAGASTADGADSQNLLAAPKSGRPINNVVPDDNLTTGVARAGGGLTVQADGAADGLRPNSPYVIRLDGAGGGELASVTSDASGNVTANVTLPDSTTSSNHTIDVTGQDQADAPVDVTQPIYMPASDNDADGDGIPDVLDTCPGAVNSGQDTDHDGIDDTCDGFIGPAAGSGGSPGDGGAGDGAGNTVTVSSNDPTPGNTNVNSGGSARVLDDRAVRPGAAASQAFKSPANISQPGYRRVFKKLPVINWLLWAALPVIAWLLVLLALAAAGRLTRQKNTQTNDFRLQ